MFPARLTAGTANAGAKITAWYRMSGELRRPVPELRCYANCRCADIYQYDESNCRPPYYTSGNSCGGKYEKCELNVEEACKGYVKSCSEGWQLRSDGRCEYDDSYGTCCNLCAGYDYEEIPEGYVEMERCESCTGPKYKIEINPCDGFSECEYGPALDAEICQSGETLKYNSCKKCPFNCSLTSCPPNNICEREDCSGLYCAVGCALNAVDLETYWCNGAAWCLVPAGNITPETGCPSGQINTEAWCGGALGCVMKL